MTGNQTLIARTVLSVVAGTIGIAAVSSARIRALPRHIFDRLITIAFIGAVGYCLFFTVPQDEVTPAVVGGLTAGFGAVVAHWLGRPHGINAPPEPPRLPPITEP